MRSKILGAFAFGLLVGPMAANAVVIDGKDWRQLTGTGGFTPAEVQSVCGSGFCTGGTGSLSVLNGWFWASSDQVRNLIEELIEPGVSNLIPGEFPGWYYYEEFNDPDIDAAIGSSLFAATELTETYERLTGWTSTCDALSGGCLFSSMINAFDPAFYDTVLIANSRTAQPWRGVWLYRPAESVPEPGTLALLGLGLAGIGLSRRRKVA